MLVLEQVQVAIDPISDGGDRPLRNARDARRQSHGPVEALLRMFGPGAIHDLRPCVDRCHVVIPLSGSARLDGAGDIAVLAAGQALLIGQEQPVRFHWAGDCAVLFLDVARTAIQIEAFSRHHEPRRVGRGNALFPRDAGMPEFEDAILALSAPNVIGFRNGAAAHDCLGAAIVGGLAALLRRLDQGGSIFPIAASVQRAIDRLDADGAAPASLEDVTRAAGVLATTLQRSVKAIAGKPLGKLVQEARLDWAHARLVSCGESRSVNDLAIAAGYRPSAFARAYQRRFGEAPSLTRSRAFAAAR